MLEKLCPETLFGLVFGCKKYFPQVNHFEGTLGLHFLCIGLWSYFFCHRNGRAGEGEGGESKQNKWLGKEGGDPGSWRL